MIEKPTNNQDTSDFEAKEKPQKNQAAENMGAYNEAPLQDPKDDEKAQDIFPELAGGTETWVEYLRRTGNPFAEVLSRQPLVWLDPAAGELTGDMEGWMESQRELIKLSGEMMTDETMAENLLKNVSLTGNIRNDALQLLRSVGAEREALRILEGAAPREILQNYANVVDSIAEASKQDPTLRKMAFTAIEIRRAAERILSQPTKKP